MKGRLCAAAAAVVMGATGVAQAQVQQSASPPPGSGYAYLHNVISVTAGGRERKPPTATCIAWADAEGLGVGPDQLDGRHGVALTLNPKPLPGEFAPPTSFAQALALAKTTYPGAPAWLWKALEANGAKIEAACGETHLDPFVVTKLTAADAKG